MISEYYRWNCVEFCISFSHGNTRKNRQETTAEAEESTARRERSCSKKRNPSFSPPFHRFFMQDCQIQTLGSSKKRMEKASKWIANKVVELWLRSNAPERSHIELLLFSSQKTDAQCRANNIQMAIGSICIELLPKFYDENFCFSMANLLLFIHLVTNRQEKLKANFCLSSQDCSSEIPISRWKPQAVE